MIAVLDDLLSLDECLEWLSKRDGAIAFNAGKVVVMATADNEDRKFCWQDGSNSEWPPSLVIRWCVRSLRCSIEGRK